MMIMKIGFCAKPDQIEAVCLDAVRASAMPAPSFNLLFPKTLLLLAPETTDEQIREYLHGALSRVQRLGGRIAVFGSGKSRNRPEGMHYDDAFRRLVQVTRLTGEIADEYDVTIVIEPLNRNETNMINSLGEGACLTAAVNHPRVKLLADYYHVALENQPVSDIERVSGIAHAHIATLAGRRVPVEPDAGYAEMFAAMKRTDYKGLISVEGKTDDLSTDGPKAVQMLKKMWEEA